ncbi:hypothetical protein A176_001521 [Myxococcus hansupus]|uniref:Uncharacterized protein n=1 Tax=Pseudomyxococcus hansupus TaxID=1297742 RepID=A0A0H4WPC7_9BACT|nr:hypothetical protein A176_001521 [Myxococcus hansupus]
MEEDDDEDGDAPEQVKASEVTRFGGVQGGGFQRQGCAGCYGPKGPSQEVRQPISQRLTV